MRRSVILVAALLCLTGVGARLVGQGRPTMLSAALGPSAIIRHWRSTTSILDECGTCQGV